MAKCVNCGRRGLFLRLNDRGMCSDCAAAKAIAEKMSLTAVRPGLVRGQAVPEQTRSGPLHVVVHPDLQDMIWTGIDDPSALDGRLEVAYPTDPASVEPLPYYPDYRFMTSLQRGLYLHFLRDPYQKIDIGYVFLLYYGLERHLIQGSYEKAYDIIIKLRDAHTNKSFQNYSASALIYTALSRKRSDLLLKFIASVDKQYEEEIPFNMFMVACKNFDIDVSPAFLMRYATKFQFTNKRYLSGNYELFRATLSEVLCEMFGSDGLPTRSIVLDKLPSCGQGVYANVSLNKQAMDFPDVTCDHQFIAQGNAALQAAHDRVKTALRKKQLPARE